MAAKHRERGRKEKKHKAAGRAPTAVPASRPVEAAEVQRGFSAFQQGRYDEAIRVWQSAQGAVNAPPGLSAALAEAYFRRAIESATVMARPRDVGVSQGGHPHSSRSLGDLRQAVGLAPQHAAYHFHLALAYHAGGELRRALPAYQEAFRLAPEDARMRRHLVQAVVSLADEPAATDEARELLSTGTAHHDEPTRRLRALVLLLGGEPAAALAALNEQANDRSAGLGRRAARSAVRRSAQPSPHMAIASGLVHLAAGQHETAQTFLDTLVRSRVQDRGSDVSAAGADGSEPWPVALVDAAALAMMSARLARGDIIGAYEALELQEAPVAAELRPAFAAMCHRLAVALALEERVAEAACALDQAVAAQDAPAEVLRCLTHLHELAGIRAARQEDYQAAAHHWEAALGHAGETIRPRLLRNLALAEERLERWEQASTRWEALIRHWRKELQEARQRREPGAKGATPGKAQSVPSTATVRHAPDELRRWLAVAYRHHAGVLESAGDFSGAIRTLERALNFDPSDFDLRQRIAELYLDEEQYGAAIEHLRRLHAARPTDTMVLIELGSALDLKGDRQQAQRCLEQAMELEPDNEAAKDLLAVVHHGNARQLAVSGADERALAEYVRAAELAPYREEHHLALGQQQLKMGQVATAEDEFDWAIRLTRNEGRLRVIIGAAYLGQGYENEAERMFRQALRVNRRPEIQAAIGVVYFAKVGYAKAEPYFKRVMKSRDASAMTAVAQTLMDAGRMEDAVPYLERAVQVDPLNIDAHLALSFNRAFGAGDYVGAEVEIQAAKMAAVLLNDRDAMATIAEAHAINAEMAELTSGLRP